MIYRLKSYLDGSTLGAKLIKATIGSAGLRIVGMFFGFLVGVQLARGLGPSGYGIYGTVMALIAVLMVPTEFGLPLLVTREVAAARAKDGHGSTVAIIAWARRWVVSSSLVIAGATYIALYLNLLPLDQSVAPVLAWGLFWIPVVAIGNVYAAALRGSHMIVTGQVGQFLIRPALISAFLFVATLISSSPITPTLAMLLNVVAAVIAVLYSITALLRSSAYSRGSNFSGDLRIGSAFPMAMSEGMRIVGGQVGVIVLGFTVPLEHVGLYRVAYGIYTVTTMPSALINSVCSPVISSLYTQNRIKPLVRLNFWTAAFLVSSSVLVLIVGAWYGREAISVLFGVRYGSAIDVLLIFLAGEVVASLFGHPTIVLNMLREQRIVMLWSGFALLLNAIITIILVTQIGYISAAIGSAIGLIIWRAGCSTYAKRSLGIDITPLTLMLNPKSIARRL